jgi:catechol 2,3-dioxygenase-like lactoylglutathione lyase family enzyme
MERVTGLGGVFFKTNDPQAMYQWYEKHLDIQRDPDGYVTFKWRQAAAPDQPGSTVWAPFAKDTRYFDPSTAPFMFNYRVADLDAVLTALREEGVWVDEKVEDTEFGRFA